MKQFKRILVAVDTRLKHHPIVEEAVELAKQNGASLKLIDVAPEFSWIAKMMVDDHEGILQAIAKDKSNRLDEIAEAVQAQRVDVETRVAVGKTSTEIVREVLNGDHDLVIAVAKGKNSSKPGYFGETATRLLRVCPCACWLVSPTSTPTFKKVLACVDTATGDKTDTELNDRILTLATNISKYHDGDLSILHAWSVANEPMLKARMDADSFASLEKSYLKTETRLLDEFLQNHDAAVSDDNVYLSNGEVEQIIAGFIRRKEVDLVVMGTIGRSGISGAFIGNTAERILGLIECSVLAIKPTKFVSPIMPRQNAIQVTTA